MSNKILGSRTVLRIVASFSHSPPPPKYNKVACEDEREPAWERGGRSGIFRTGYLKQWPRTWKEKFGVPRPLLVSSARTAAGN